MIFEGTAESVASRQQYLTTDRYYAIRFTVEKMIKGEAVAAVTVFTGPAQLCGVHYEEGKRYTVHAIDNGYLVTKNCYGLTLN